MKCVLTPLSIAVTVISMFALAACGSSRSSTPPTVPPPPPPPSSFTISGTVVNLAGTGGGLVLQDNLSESLAVNANGSFTFAATVTSGGSYSVSISVQPTNPEQTCGVSNGSGEATADVTNIEINCGHDEWTWAKGPNTATNNGVYGTPGVAATSNNPGGRQAPVSWTDASGDLWLFGGYGLDSAGTLLPMNDVWKYSAGQWTWEGGSNIGGQKGTYGVLGNSAMTNIPGARMQAVSWTDASGDLWLFGGLGYDSVGTEASLNDLWKYSAGEWTWMGGSNLANQKGTYGTLGSAASSNIPGARCEAVSWIDSSGDFWLFGGLGYDSSGTRAPLNDLWIYSNGEWTWESGSELVNQSGVYGTQGVAAPGNVPGARFGNVSWRDRTGNLWLFGGTGFASSAVSGTLNDLWKYRNGEWTWMSGSSAVNGLAVYGVEGIPAAGNVPGPRQNPVSWTDLSGNLWLMGGSGKDSATEFGLLNDLWKYRNGEWTWVSGSDLSNQDGTYGTQGTPSLGNIPGGRFDMISWRDVNGNLWLFGGFGIASGPPGNLSDLWMYLP